MQRISRLATTGLLRFLVATPPRLRPGLWGAFAIAAVMLARVVLALPRIAAGRESASALFSALLAASAAAFVGGTCFGFTRPLFRGRGLVGDVLTGVVMAWGYLGSLLFASPWIFERSAIPDDAVGWLLWAGVSTVVGAFGGPLLFRDGELERAARMRRLPALEAIEGNDGLEVGWVVSGWIRCEQLAAFVSRVTEVTRARHDPELYPRLLRSFEAGERRVDAALESTGGIVGAIELERRVKDWLAFGVRLDGGEEEECAERLCDRLADVTGDPIGS